MDKEYLAICMNNLGTMFDYAINDCKVEKDSFFNLFLNSKVCNAIEAEIPKYTVGMSGIEYAFEILPSNSLKQPSYNIERSKEYWAGWILMYLKNETNLSFLDIYNGGFTIEKILSLYHFHESDPRNFVDYAKEYLRKNA